MLHRIKRRTTFEYQEAIGQCKATLTKLLNRYRHLCHKPWMEPILFRDMRNLHEDATLSKPRCEIQNVPQFGWRLGVYYCYSLGSKRNLESTKHIPNCMPVLSYDFERIVDAFFSDEIFFWKRVVLFHWANAGSGNVKFPIRICV